MPAPTITKGDALGRMLSQAAYREVFRPATAASQGAGGGVGPRPASGPVYPRPR